MVSLPTLSNLYLTSKKITNLIICYSVSSVMLMKCRIIKNTLLKIPCSVAMVNVQAIFGVFTGFILEALN